MFKANNFGDVKNPKSNFSATRSHVLDHERTLGKVELYMDSYHAGAGKGGAGVLLPKRWVQTVVDDFCEHVKIFDSKYEEFCGGNKKKEDADAWMEKVECKACD